MKKSIFKRVFVAMLAAIMLLSIVSCNNNAAEENLNTPSGDDTTTTADTSVYFDIIKDGKCIPIRYGAGATGAEIQIAKGVADKIGRATGAAVELDISVSYDANKLEIIVGHGAAADYPEVEQAISELGYGEGLAKMIGNKLVIVGADTESIELVIDEMVKVFMNTKDENNNVRVSDKFIVSQCVNEMIAKMPFYDGYTPTVVDRNDGCYSFEFKTNKNAFEKYLKLLTDSGFELYASNTIDENVYNTYVNEETGIVATSIYAEFNGQCRLLMEWLDNTELPTKAEDNKYTPVEGLESSITQIGLWYANGNTPLISPPNAEGREYYNYFNGMSYAIRLADGSFIVVDGGHDNPVSAQNLYNILKEQAPDPDNIVIAAWFISHDHSDHTGIFGNFIGKYKDVEIERFIYNFPGEELGNEEGMGKKLRSLIKGFYPNAKIIKAHPGQEFNIRNAKITMLYTMDVYFKDTLSDTNNASIVWKMELNGKTFMCLGDYSEGGDTLLNLYSAETLKSDIVQVAHHGISGMSNEVYVKIAPEYALWPVANFQLDWNGIGGNKPIDLTAGSHGAMNKYILDMPDEKVFVARDNVSIIAFDKDGNIKTSVYETVSEYIGLTN
ncbi:MAG: hypothetical protein E7607_07125 [Ruminococcaceae bacterium]|nr:hypothetical protein [Oscillospiraceae bacterium]